MRNYRQLMAITILIGIVGLSLPALSQERDADGTRMQARHVDVGTVHSDRLTPPQDTADWRMIQLEDRANLELKLTVESSGAKALLTLTGSTGDELATETTDSTVSIERTLDAGIYYIAVQADEALRYELRID